MFLDRKEDEAKSQPRGRQDGSRNGYWLRSDCNGRDKDEGISGTDVVKVRFDIQHFKEMYKNDFKS